MGVKNQGSSEYRRSFKSMYPCFTKVYEHNVDYRIQRRNFENHHQTEPFLWDSDSSSSSSDIAICSDLTPKPYVLSIPHHIHKHEKYNKAYQDRLHKLTQQLENNLQLLEKKASEVEVAVADNSKQDSQVEPAELHPQVNGAAEHVMSEVVLAEAEQDAKVPDKIDIKQQKPKQPIKKAVHKPFKHVPKPRPFSASLGRPIKSLGEPVKRAPFLSYGAKDEELQTGNKKTYNIRASADIYPSALLAQKRRKAVVEKREEDMKSASFKEKRKHALFNEFNEKVKRETAQWATEYRSRFTGYEKGVYERSLSARSAPRYHDNSLLGATW